MWAQQITRLLTWSTEVFTYPESFVHFHKHTSMLFLCMHRIDKFCSYHLDYILVLPTQETDPASVSHNGRLAEIGLNLKEMMMLQGRDLRKHPRQFSIQCQTYIPLFKCLNAFILFYFMQCTYIYVFIKFSMPVCLIIYICIYTYIFIFIYIYIYIYIYLFIYLYIFCILTGTSLYIYSNRRNFNFGSTHIYMMSEHSHYFNLLFTNLFDDNC